MNQPGYRKFCDLDEFGKPELIRVDDFAEELFARFENIEFAFSNELTEGVGDLYITTGRIIWVGINSKVFDFDVPYIILHALTHDLTIYNKPCLYCQLASDESEQYKDQDDSDDQFSECYFAPLDNLDLSKLFDSFSEAAQRNPDPDEDEYDGVEGSDDLIYNIDEVMLGSQQINRLNHLESVFKPPEPQQFED